MATVYLVIEDCDPVKKADGTLDSVMFSLSSPDEDFEMSLLDNDPANKWTPAMKAAAEIFCKVTEFWNAGQRVDSGDMADPSEVE